MVSQAHKTLHFTPWILLNFMLLILVSSNSDLVSHYTDFVYEQCRNETRIPHTLVSSLMQELVEKSTESKFYQTSSGDDFVAISGKFQCRHDLTIESCHDCIVNTVTRLTCSSGSLARVQLKGCFMSLEPEPEPRPEIGNRRIGTEGLVGGRKDYLQHKKCGERRSWLEGLEEVRDVAFESVAKCVTSSGVGYCDKRYEGMYAMGQCEGSLEVCECGECVSNAFQVAQDECWGSDSGEVYLENCFISFSDYQPHKGKGAEGGSGKIAAMVVGVGVAIALLSTLCYCIRSSTRKQDDW
ncbi:putative Gnk2-like domain-containing protein [Helianthus annuus]|uniref:Gnk2-like domain-containing protein n=1 Tax=Helianthus annuus TaxID=4232 RepID=A0A251UQR0_HELAN|nr:plasmodesmata-located protein 4 [Helianthus annuus]KAF5805914.1 putative Gnk2-like domain-containing protein [Helianthus annuus]KAJ0918989.1 putative Gnk2-like domain-containing protein [Helianthus annuus]